MGSHRHHVSRVRLGIAGVVGIVALAIPAPALATDCPTGVFMAAAGPDTASAIEINKNGQFRYMLSEGAVDESADGRWNCKDGSLLLSTTPTPKAPAFTLDKIVQNARAPFSLIVTWPDGRGVAGVDFLLKMESGDPIADYTQASGWSGDLGKRKPRSVHVSEPFYGTQSPKFALPPDEHQQIRIILTPNDMGKADFRDTLVTQDGSGLVLHWRGREIPYAPAADD